jgi:hypothetical protein
MHNIHDTPFSSFVWFLGVVEDIDDPKKAHRVRVRCLGFHSEDRANVPVDALPWAPVLQGSGFMVSAPGLLPSDWVVGFFLDGSEAQQPVVLGKMEGIPAEKVDASMGFSDPSGVYPKKIGVPTNSSLARGEVAETAIEWKNGSLAPGEPASPYAAVYPKNLVTETPAGHVVELDDTEGAERVHIFHKSGTFYEVHPDGKLVVRSVADAYEAVLANKTLYVSGDLTIQAAGNVTLRAGGDLRLESGGDMTLASGGSFHVGASGPASVIASGILELNGSVVRQGEGSNKAGSAQSVPSASASKYR